MGELIIDILNWLHHLPGKIILLLWDQYLIWIDKYGFITATFTMIAIFGSAGYLIKSIVKGDHEY